MRIHVKVSSWGKPKRCRRVFRGHGAGLKGMPLSRLPPASTMTSFAEEDISSRWQWRADSGHIPRAEEKGQLCFFFSITLLRKHFATSWHFLLAHWQPVAVCPLTCARSPSVGRTDWTQIFDVWRAACLTRRQQRQPSFLELAWRSVGLLQTKVVKVRRPFEFIDMPRRTGWHNPAAMGKSLPERGLLLLMVWLFLEGSVLPLGAASSPDVTQKADLDNHKMSEQRHNETKKPFPVLSLDYENVRTPFEIALWVLLASLMKLGEYWSNVCASCERSSSWEF